MSIAGRSGGCWGVSCVIWAEGVGWGENHVCHRPKGWWVGVKFDEPVGKNDGAVKGERYFTCPDGYGSFQRPENVTVGDYPDEDDPFGESEDEI